MTDTEPTMCFAANPYNPRQKLWFCVEIHTNSVIRSYYLLDRSAPKMDMIRTCVIRISKYTLVIRALSSRFEYFSFGVNYPHCPGHLFIFHQLAVSLRSAIFVHVFEFDVEHLGHYSTKDVSSSRLWDALASLSRISHFHSTHNLNRLQRVEEYNFEGDSGVEPNTSQRE